MGIATFVRLLPIFCGEYQEIELIKRLSNHFHFDHHFYLMHSSADSNRYTNTKGFTPQSLYEFKNEDNDTDLDKVIEISSKNTFLIVVPENSRLHQSSNSLRRLKKVQRLQINMKIGVFFSRPSSMADLYALFEWCKENLIINIFAAIYPSSEALTSCPQSSIEIFTFDPFGKLEVLNVTDSETCDGFLRSRYSNFQQHKLLVGRTLRDRSDATLWRTVFRIMNASFVDMKYNLNWTLIEDAFADGVDVYPYLIPLIAPKEFNVYPVTTTYVAFIVPEALPYSEFSAYLRNATSGELIGYCFISIVAAILALGILRYINRKEVLFIRSAVDVFNLLLNDNGNIRYQQLSRSEVFVIVPLTFVGLIVMSGILSNLKSHLTRPALQHQINTLEEIYTSPFPIYAEEEFYQNEAINTLSDRTGKDWSSKIKTETNQIYFDYMYSNSQKMSFIAFPLYIESLIRVQKRLKIKGYYNTNIKINYFYYGYLLHEKFLYFERLNEIIGRIKSAGLIDQWQRKDYQISENEFEREIHSKNSKETNVSDVESFEFPTVLFYGWAIGVVIFILEIFWNHFKFLSIREILRIVVLKFGH